MQYNEAKQIRVEARKWLKEKGCSEGVSLGVGRIPKAKEQYRLSARIRRPEPEADFHALVDRSLQEVVKAPGQVDLQFTGPVFILGGGDAGVRTARLRIGSSISHKKGRSGTLGFFARSRDGQQLGLVSANHVISVQDRGKLNDEIVHPGGHEGSTVATFVRDVPLAGGGERFVDCAFAALTTDNYDLSILPDGSRLRPDVAALDDSVNVTKCGSVSGERKGVITSSDKDDLEVLSYRSGIGIVDFDDQIEVESVSERRFSLAGDSGSLVYNEHGRAVGLLFAHTIRGGTFDNGFAYINPMSRVLNLLNVDLATA